MIIKAGSVDRSVYITIVDSTDGTPETGVVAATAGLALEYVRTGFAAVSIGTISDLTSASAAHTDGGIKHVGYGTYRVDVPDAAWAVLVEAVEIIGTATGMVVLREQVQLVGYDPRLELTSAVIARIDAAVSSRLAPTSSGRTLDVTATGAAGIDWSNIENKTATVDLTDTTIESAGSISVTQIASALNAAIEGTTLYCRKGDSLSATITGLTSNTGYSRLYFVVKDDATKADAAAKVLIRLTSPSSGDGLLYLNEATYATGAHGSITVVSATSLTIALDEVATALLDLVGTPLTYYIKQVVSGTVTTVTSGEFVMVEQGVEAVS